MYRGNFPPGGFPSQFPANVSSGGGGAGVSGGGGNGPRPRFNSAERFPPPQRQQQERERAPPPPPVDDDIIVPRPIIKEEDLTGMDEISHDAGWAAHDDIDYNQKLAFSDDENEPVPPRRDDRRESPPKEDKLIETPIDERERPRDNRDKDSRDPMMSHMQGMPPHRNWYQDRSSGQRDFRGSGGPPARDIPRDNYQISPPQQQQQQQQQIPPPPRPFHPLRGVEVEEEIWSQRRREQGEKVASAIERARQRKEEEEKRFQESSKQAAAKKLQDLEQKLKEKQAKQKDDEPLPVSEPKGLISVPPVPIPVPEWEREKESRDRDRERSRTSSEGKDEKSRDNRVSREPPSEFGQGNNRTGFMRQQQQQQQDSSRVERERERDREQREGREREPSASYRHFQSNLPPRFQKQQAERSSATGTSRVSPNSDRSIMQAPFTPQYADQSNSGGGRWSHSKHGNDITHNLHTPMSVKDVREVNPVSQRRGKVETDGSPMEEEQRVTAPFVPQYVDQGNSGGRWSHKHPNEMSHNFHTPMSGGIKESHTMPRRVKADSDVSSIDDEQQLQRSRDHGGSRSRDDSGFGSSRDNRIFDTRRSGHYNDYNRSSYKDYEHDDRHRSERRESDRHYDDKEVRESRDSRDIREQKEKPDYDNYRRQSPQQQQQEQQEDRQIQRQESGGEWRDTRRDDHQLVERDNRREESTREVRIERNDRNERPQRPDSRDSRTSRESKTSLRDDDTHKLREIGSWAQDTSDYDEKKRESYQDHRESERANRWQLPGPVTREKLVADELKSDKRGMIPLKRGSVDLQEKKDSPTEIKKEAEAWNRKIERASDNARTNERSEISSKIWSDAVSPTFEEKEEEMEEEEKLEPVKDDKDIGDIKETMNKLCVEEREDSHNESSKDDTKDEKREKNVRNRTNSGGSRTRETRGGGSGAGSRTWHAHNVFGRNWRGPEIRGRRVTIPRSMGRSGSVKSGSYGHSELDMSGDEVATSNESSKDDRRSAISPKPSTQTMDKDERNREVSRRDDKRATDYSQGRNEKRGYEVKPSREGFAPSGEPSRRGRGGFRTRGAATGYGPPSSKSPFSSERTTDEKSQQNPSQNTPDNDTNATESTDDKMIAKQQALTAGITGRRNKSPNLQSHPINNKQDSANHAGTMGPHVGAQRNLPKKEDARVKRNRSGSRRGRDTRRATGGNVIKQNSTDVGNEDWETTSENSEDVNEHKESMNNHPKQFGGRQGSNTSSLSRRNDSQGNNRDQREKKPSGPSSRGPGGEKRNAQNSTLNQRNHSGSMPPPVQNSQVQNGRPRSQGSANSGSGGKPIGKDTTVNRMDEIKFNDPGLVDQAINDINKKSQSKEKKIIDADSESNNYSASGDDGGNGSEEKVDADGFQEVRSKKTVKDSRHGQKEEPKPARREKDKERERDRSKSKSNGPQATPQPVQNIPSLLGQPIPQPANMPPKPFDRNPNRQKLAPRFQKQRMAKQQQQHIGDGNGESSTGKINSTGGSYMKDAAGGPAPPPPVNAWDKPFTSQLRSNSPSSVPADIQLMSGLAGTNEHAHDMNEQHQANSGNSSQRNSPSVEKPGKSLKDQMGEKNVSDTSSPPVQTLIFENTNYSKKTGPSDMAIKSKFSNPMKSQQSRGDKRGDLDEDGGQMQHQQQAMSVAFSSKLNDLIKDKTQEPIQMPMSFNKSEDSADIKLDFTFDSDLSQLTDDKTKSLGMTRSIHMTGGQSTISPSTADLNLKIASVKTVWENAPPMPTVVEHEDGSVVTTANTFTQSFEATDVEDTYNQHQQYAQNQLKNEITTSTNVCKVRFQLVIVSFVSRMLT